MRRSKDLVGSSPTSGTNNTRSIMTAEEMNNLHKLVYGCYRTDCESCKLGAIYLIDLDDGRQTLVHEHDLEES